MFTSRSDIRTPHTSSSRRDWLKIGALSGLGLAHPGLGKVLGESSRQDQPRDASFGRAKRCIVLFMFGAPAHQDTWDMKPQAPAEIRGEFSQIDSATPGINVCEHLPMLSQRTQHLCQLRSVTHPDNTHTVAMHTMLTGIRHKRPATNPQNAPDDTPCYGSVVNYIAEQSRQVSIAGLPSAAGLPPAISLNAPANQVSANNHIFPGFFAGYLGTRYDPLFVSDSPHKPDFAPFTRLEAVDRVRDRRTLLQQMESQFVQEQQRSCVFDVRTQYDQAFDLLTSNAVTNAFDLSAESNEVRDTYGRTPFGQGCLLARRLLEADVKLVTVNWERDDAYWDTHANNFKDLKGKLLPNLDRGFSALIDDLQSRGLWDDTLIVWLGEFGRTPKINANAGRDHWAPVNTVILAGAGLPGGTLYGASDKEAAYPLRDPVTPTDLSATIYHHLGINPRTELHDNEGRPYVLTPGEPVWGVLS
ncbi:MAG: DUF1501 domain-containing protein [Planctomycetota bacterium]|nr:DUF1501 domain-containing protein [Planctomycetota bacterium]MDA1215221.1 DUF1501 domain-containing protein [Planctomycetota bacterium]